VLGFSAYNYTFYLLLTWVPSYLSKALHVDCCIRLLCKRALACRNSQGFFLGRVLVNFLIHKGWNAIARPASRTDRGTSFGLAYLERLERTLGQRGILDEYFPGRPFAASPVCWSILL